MQLHVILQIFMHDKYMSCYVILNLYIVQKYIYTAFVTELDLTKLNQNCHMNYSNYL